METNRNREPGTPRVLGPRVGAVVRDRGTVVVRVLRRGDKPAPRSVIRASDDTGAAIRAAVQAVAERVKPALAPKIRIVRVVSR
jgi:hypothetical protein